VSADAPPTSPKPSPSSRASAREWAYRALALVAIPAALFLGLEFGLRLAGYGQSVRFLVPDEAPGMLRTNPEFVSSFLPSSFDLRPLNTRIAAKKKPGTVRIVVLGESAAQGVPVPAFGFAAQLRAQLRARYPGRDFEVINTGIVAINSHVVYQVARELAGYSPDLFIVYMGNNEVVGPYGPGCAYLSEMPPLWVIRLSVFVRSTRTGQLMTSLIGRLARRSRPPEEWGGMAMFANNTVAGDDPRLESVYRNFGENLRDIVRAAHGGGAKVLLCTVASNLRDCAPLFSQHRPGLAGPELAQWKESFERGRIEWLLGEDEAARRDLAESLRIDPQYADTEFLLGTLDYQASRIETARLHFVAAEHWDALRFRPDPRINEIIRQVAGEMTGRAGLLDAAMIMGSDPASGAAPAGRDLFFEHVHFDWNGNFILAHAMAERSEEALFAGAKGAGPWLDSRGCAAALGYTPHERLAVLEKIGPIIQNPPFTNQLTYPEDEARLARDIALAKADHDDRQKAEAARATVLSALSADPANPDLLRMKEDLDDELGDLAGALADAHEAQALQPRSYALGSDEAIKLSRLGRYGEAERLLRDTQSRCTPRDMAAMAPAFSDLFVRTKRFDEGRRYLEGSIALFPGDMSLRLALGRLERFAGVNAAAERAYREALAISPANKGAMEALVGLLHDEGRDADAESQGFAAAEQQLGNQSNDLRLAILCNTKGDADRSIRFLIAAERSGPVSADMEMFLAMDLLKAGRLDEALARLGEARRISAFEGNPALTEKIAKAINRVRSQMR